MNYKSVNALHDFEFHDAHWEFAAWDAASLSVFAKHLNLHQNAPRNDSGCDMEIQLARLAFRGFRAISYAPGVAWETDEEGQSSPAEPLKTYGGGRSAQSIPQGIAAWREFACSTAGR